MAGAPSAERRTAPGLPRHLKEAGGGAEVRLENGFDKRDDVVGGGAAYGSGKADEN